MKSLQTTTQLPENLLSDYDEKQLGDPHIHIEVMLRILRAFEIQLKQTLEVKQLRIDNIITDEIRIRLNTIDKEFAQQIGALQSQIDDIIKIIKSNADQVVATVKYENYMAVWTGPKVKFDINKLLNYAVENPEIMTMVTSTKPSISIRRNSE